MAQKKHRPITNDSDALARALQEQLAAVGAELLAGRHEAGELRAQLAAVGAELLASRHEADALRGQLSAVGAELAAVRAENRPLHDQLAAVGAELADSRGRAAALEHQILRMIPVDPDQVLSGDDDGRFGMRPDAYIASLRRLEEELNLRPQNLALRERLARAYLLQPMGGPRPLGQLGNLAAAAFNPDAAMKLLVEAPAGDERDMVLVRTARRLATPPIVIAALPKSASVFLLSALRDGLGKPASGSVHGGQFPTQALERVGFGDALQLRAVVHTHLSASPANLIDLFEYFKLDRLLVQVRDPRQALISWFHFMPSVIANADHSLALHWQVPADYGSWPCERQLDWCIDGWYRLEIDWMMEWLEAAARPALHDRILFTRFEDMVTDQPAYFARILDFYGIPSELFDPPAPPKAPGEHNFRLGRIDEWREVLTPVQVRRVSEAIPDALYERFGWPRR